MGTWQWGLELQSYGFAGSERTVSGQPRVNTVGPRVTYDWDATLQEWFVNDRHGLEHGFTVRERPPHPIFDHPLLLGGGEGRGEGAVPLTFTLAVRGGLRPEVLADGRGVRFVDAQGAAALTYSELTVLDADGQKLPARFEVVAESNENEPSAAISTLDVGCWMFNVGCSQPESTARALAQIVNHQSSIINLVVDERGARYPLTIDPIAQQAYLKASNTGAGDEVGSSVAVSGDTVVVGAVGESSNATGVNGDQTDNSAGVSGAAYVYVRNGTTWTQEAYLKASNPDPQDGFGWSVAVSGNTVVVGALQEGSSATGVNGDESDNHAWYNGAAYVFVRNGADWSQQAYLKASYTEANNVFLRFGSSVAVSGDTVVVGAPGESSNATGVDGDQSDNSAANSGAAYVFVRSDTSWSQQAYLKASNTGADDRFGSSVAVSGDTVVIGAAGEDSSATGVNGNQNDSSAIDSGAAYIFARSGATWSQQAYLKASNTRAGDSFGGAVAVSGDTVVIGAAGEDSNATGVNGNQNDSSAIDSGAAYIFARSGATWSQQAYLKASNTDAQDRFGIPVAVSGDTVVVGANGESSDATGANGNQNNNSTASSGAAYVFVRNGATWTQQAYLKASNTGGGDRLGAVAIAGDTVVVGAYGEASNATGVNGDGSDNSAPYSGAAYIFTGFGPPPTLTLVPDGSGGYFINIEGRSSVTYILQRAPSVTGPWSDIVTNTAPAFGLIEYHETSPPPGAGFYRTVQP